MRTPKTTLTHVCLFILGTAVAIALAPPHFSGRSPAEAVNIPERCQKVAEFVTRLDLGMSTDPANPYIPTRDRERKCIPSEKELSEFGAEELVKRVADCDANGFLANLPWALLESSKLEALRAGYLIMFNLASALITEKTGQRPGGNSRIQAIESTFETLIKNGPGDLSASTTAIRKQLRSGDTFASDWLAPLLSQRLCEVYSSSGCADAFKDTLKRFEVRQMTGGGVMGMPELLGKFLTDPINARATGQVALRIINQIRSAESGVPVTRHFFDDIKEAFLQTGVAEPEATQRTWDLLAVYSLQGAAIHWFAPVFTNENAPVAAALYVIAAGVGYLDGFSIGKWESRYSLPPETETKCIYGKPYHFWLSAYLARAAAQETDYRAGSAAAHLAGLGYEYSSGTWGRSSSALNSSERDSLYLDSIRLNIAFGDAGVVYGARAGTGRRQLRLPIDEGAAELLLHWQTPKYFHTFFGWRERFGADAAWFHMMHE